MKNSMTNYLDSLNQKQLEAAKLTEGAVLVLSGPGSGKTRVITHRIAHILDSKLATPEEILAVTFTNKAAGENQVLDFDDLIMQTVLLFENHPTVLKKYQNRFKYVLVDEYQNTNRAQYRLPKLLAQKHKNIFVVGDASQAIYGWRGADYKN